MCPAGDSFESTPRPPLCAHAPALWSLLPLLAGIVAGRLESAWGILIAVCLFLLAAIKLNYSRRMVAITSLLMGVVLSALSVEGPHPLWHELPPREATITMEVVETFNARRPERISGIGRILANDIPFDTVSGRLSSYYLEHHSPAAPGSAITCRAVLTYLPFSGDDDGFHLYLKKRDIHLTLNRGRVLGEATPPPWHEARRQAALRTCRRVLMAGSTSPEDPGHVLASMLLGDRSLLTGERVELYRRTGTYHLFAVSGLHVGSVAICLHWLCGLVRLTGFMRLLTVLAGTWGYVWLTGASPSAMRAGIMITCLGLARHLLRQPHLFPALVFSAWIVLLWHPQELFDLGFQLSYCVVGSIILMGLPLAGELRNRLGWQPQVFRPRHYAKRLAQRSFMATADLACVSLSAGLGSMPLIIQHFNLFTPVGVLLGVILNPLAGLCVMAGCMAMLGCPVLGVSLTGLWAKITWLAIHTMEFLLEASLAIPGAVSDRSWTWPPMGILVILSALSLALILQRLRQSGRRLPAVSLILPHAFIVLSLLFTTVNA